MFNDQPHPLTLTEGWEDLSPHEKKEKMQNYIKEENEKEAQEEQEAKERFLANNNVQALIDCLSGDAVVAQSAEQLPCKQQVEGSIPSDSTSLEPVSHQRHLNMQAQIQDQEECLEIYEGVLRAIASITKVETPADQSAEAFFFVASKMRKMAIAALQKTGAML